MEKKVKKRVSRKKKSLRKNLGLLLVIAVLLGAVIILLPSRKPDSEQEYAELEETPRPELPRKTENPLAAEKSGEPTKIPVPAATNTPAGSKDVTARIALVFDDAGYSLADLQPLLRSPLALTIAVLPGLAHSEEAAGLAGRNGKEVILHQPMEAVNGNALGPGGILTSDSPAAIIETLKENIAAISGLKGINNHMGSLATADWKVMDTVMDFLESKDLFFLDSRTTAETVAGEVSKQYDLPFISRDVFLDNVVEYEAIRTQLDQGLEQALAKGSAVLIGHVQHPLVIEVVQAAAPEFEAAGVEFVYLSELVF